MLVCHSCCFVYLTELLLCCLMVLFSSLSSFCYLKFAHAMHIFASSPIQSHKCTHPTTNTHAIFGWLFSLNQTPSRQNVCSLINYAFWLGFCTAIAPALDERARYWRIIQIYELTELLLSFYKVFERKWRR